MPANHWRVQRGNADLMKDKFNTSVVLYTASLFNFHGSIMLLLFPSTVVSLNLHTKEVFPRETAATSGYYCTGATRTSTLFFRSSAALNPFFFSFLFFSFCTSYTVWARCNTEQTTKAQSQFHMCLSQSEYFHQQHSSLLNLARQ